MTKEDIIRMAREARIEQDGDMFYSFRNSDKDQDVHIDDLVRFAALVAAHEREACAKMAEDTDRMVLALLNVTSQPKHIAAAIRARSNI